MDWMEAIRAYVPCCEREEKDKEIFLYCMNAFDDVFTRSNRIVHMTSSAFVVNRNRDKVLMVYHNIYDSWSWTGGHADGEKDLLAVALKEAKEETGVVNIRPVIEDIFSLDVLPVWGHMKRGEYVPAHLHLTATYLLEAEEADTLKVKTDENSDVRWIPADQVVDFSSEPHMKKIYDKLIKRIETL